MLRNKLICTTLAAFSIFRLAAQDIPQKIEVAQLTSDANQQFNVLHFTPINKEKFSILYYQYLNGTVSSSNEFIRDTGEVAYSDKKRKEKDMIPNSESAMLLVRQTVDRNGTATIEKTWILAKRQLGSANDFKLYFRKKYTHPLVKSHTPVELTAHNLSAVQGLSEAEMQALTAVVKRDYFPDPVAAAAAPGQQSLADGLKQMKSNFKSLRETGLTFRGDLPKNEDVLSRFGITDNKSLVITKLKDKDKSRKNFFTLKFYLTAEYKTFDLVDSTVLEGDLTPTSLIKVYTENAEIAGANVNYSLKTKNDKGEEAQILTYLLDQNNQLHLWKHSVGKNKSASYTAKVAWYKDNDLMIISTNDEKMMKPVYQLHKFTKGGAATFLYPATEEQKGADKFKYVQTFQAENMKKSLAPIPERQDPMLFYTINGTRYIICQGYKRDINTSTDQYVSLTIFRISEDNKVTDIQSLEEYNAPTPTRLDLLTKTKDKVYFMPYYETKFQLTLDKDQIAVAPIETPTMRLVPSQANGDLVVKNSSGSLLLGKATMGYKYTLLFYPEQ